MSLAVTLRCQCGQVECHSSRAPMLTAVCYCDDCQAAAREIEAGGTGPPVACPDGGSALTLLRLDGFAMTKGEDRLVAHRLRPDSPTSRMVASCCNSAMFLRFADWRFWVSAFVERFDGDWPEIEARIETRYRQSALPWPDDSPRFATFPNRWLFRLLGEWFKMKLDRS